MLKVAIVGTGNISASHIRGYLEFGQRCKIVALCDIVPERAEQVRAEFGLTDAEVYADHAEVVARGDIDVVSVCTPPATHTRISSDLLRAGKHVLCEKPMAPSVADCDEMLQAQREGGALLSVVAQNRFRDEIAVVKEVIDSGLLGPVSSVRVDSSWWRGVPYYDLSWRGTWESEGGGPTLNHAIHHVDLMVWMLGAPGQVRAMMTNAWHDNAEVEDLSVALLGYERGIAQLTSSVIHHGEQQQIVVQGSNAAVAQPWAVYAESTQDNGFPEPGGNTELIQQLEDLRALRAPLRHTGHTAQIDDVLTAVARGTAPAIDGVAGRATVEVVTAIYQAAIEGATVELPLAPDDPYYNGSGIAQNAPRYFTKTASVSQQSGFITVGGSGDSP